MKKAYVLYNPLSGTTRKAPDAAELQKIMEADWTVMDITKLDDYAAFVSTLQKEDCLVVAGGDGTLNRFVNNTEGLEIPCEILYYPAGTGNDFARDVAGDDATGCIRISQKLADLPVVEVKGKKYRFINGVGFGIDGFCCEVGDELRRGSDKKVNYTAIAIRGLLVDYLPTTATVTVDGVRQTYQKVWLAPTMFGKYYGGGMIPTPEQTRTDDTLSVMLFHGSGKLRTLMIFPSIFKGKHVKHQKHVKVLRGKEIMVEFDEPRPLQIDGETILNVRSYTARRFDSAK